jgi:hypothetical protein
LTYKDSKCGIEKEIKLLSETILILKGSKMIYSQDKELLSYAMKMGCKTAAEFALFLKARESILSL